MKSDATRDLIAAVEALQHNRTYFTSRVSEMILAGYIGRGRSEEVDASSPILTPREREIMQLLAEGMTSKDVANHLNLAVKTAETHRSNIMRKLGVHSLSELVLCAVRNNIIQVTVDLPTATARRASVAAYDLDSAEQEAL